MRMKRAGWMVPVDDGDNEIEARRPCRFWVGPPEPGSGGTRGEIKLTLDPPAYSWERPKQGGILRFIFFGDPLEPMEKVPTIEIEWVKLMDTDEEPIVYYGVHATLRPGDSLRMNTKS